MEKFQMHKFQREKQFKYIDERQATLARLDTNLGDATYQTRPFYTLETDLVRPNQKMMKLKEITFSMGVLKIFLEILQNAIDTQFYGTDLTCVKVDIVADSIRVWNDGVGMPVVEAMIDGRMQYHISALFSRHHSSSNLDDSTKPPYVGGKNGMGAKLTNTLSKLFTVRTFDSLNMREFEQTWTNNMSITAGPKVTSVPTGTYATGFTEIFFTPDVETLVPNWKTFEQTEALTPDTKQAIEACVVGARACALPSVNVYFNSTKIKAASFQDFAKLFKQPTDQMAYDAVWQDDDVSGQLGIARMEICVIKRSTPERSNAGHVGFVNALRCNNGTHMDYVHAKIAEIVHNEIKHKRNNESFDKKKIKDYFIVLVRALIVNPLFDSQVKDRMNAPLAKDFGFQWVPSDDFKAKLNKLGVASDISATLEVTGLSKLINSSNMATAEMKTTRPIIDKYEGAENAGCQGSDCTLIIVEGDSAKNLIISGFSVIGRRNYGVYPIRGKIKNVRNKASKTALESSLEVRNIMSILGYTCKGNQTIHDLRYKHILIVTDMDADGAHITGLLMCVFSTLMRDILESNPNFVQRLATPELRLTLKTNKSQFIEFTSAKGQYKQWMAEKNYSEADVSRIYHVKYFKGLGSSTPQDAQRYFSNLKNLQISLKYENNISERETDVMFSKKMEAHRKDMMSLNFDPSLFVDYSQHDVSWGDFYKKEVVPFSMENCIRTIAHFTDGLKPAHRQVLYTMLTLKMHNERKVAEIAGSVIALTHYAHGEASLQKTISCMPQDFWCTNNINLLEARGFFGSRIGGRESFSQPRYTFTCLNTSIVYALFPEVDMALCPPVIKEGEAHEPLVLAPVVPFVLINGSNGMGTGWSHTVYPHNPMDVIQAVRDCIKGAPIKAMLPWFVHFKGRVFRDPNTQTAVCEGLVKVHEMTDDTVTLHVTELPFQAWRESYIKTIEEKYLVGGKRFMELKKKAPAGQKKPKPAIKALIATPGGLVLKSEGAKQLKRKRGEHEQDIDKKKNAKKKQKVVPDLEGPKDVFGLDKTELDFEKNELGLDKTELGLEGPEDELDLDKTELDFGKSLPPPFILSPIETFECSADTVSLKIRCCRKIYENDVKGQELRILGLIKSMPENNMNLWDLDNKLHKFASCSEIVQTFCEWRKDLYVKRKQLLVIKKQESIVMLSNKARFITGVAVEGTIKILNRPSADLNQELINKKFDKINGSFTYLLALSTNDYSKEAVARFKVDEQAAKVELTKLTKTDPVTMWIADLDTLEIKYNAFHKERQDRYEKIAESETNKKTFESKKGVQSQAKNSTEPKKKAIKDQKKQAVVRKEVEKVEKVEVIDLTI